MYKIKVRKRKSTDLVLKPKRIFSRIKDLGGGSTLGWKIGEEILNSKKSIKTVWLRAFFDDEGTVDRTKFVVRIKSMNKNGLIQAKMLMEDIKVPSRITGPNCDKSWYLTVVRKDLEKFQKTIGFSHTKKITLLENIIKQS